LESYFVYIVARFFLGLFRFLPRRLALPLLDILALIAYWLDWKHRRIARVNLTIAFPSLSPEEHGRIVRKSFKNTARNLLELSRLDRYSSNNIASIISYDRECGLENYLAAKATGKPILYLTGHFNAWELLPAAHALYGHPLSFVTRPLDNPMLDMYLRQLRQASGNQVIPKKNSARAILERLKAGAPVGILMDQNTSLQEGVFVDFFGIPAATSTSLALFGLRVDAVIVPGFLTPPQSGRYTIKFLPHLDLIRTGDMNQDVRLNTQRINQILEGIIRQYPESWLWGHKRWKNQPEGNPADLYRLSLAELRRFLERHRSDNCGL
jgi:KDO2-lipid IV(A) lauroyltransferase